MKKLINKKSLIIMSAVLLLLIGVGTTLAYVFTSSGPVENTFDPSKVACAVIENGNADPITGAVTDTGSTKTNVQIKNTGDTDAYVRVTVVINWASEDGSKVWAAKPVENTEYTITYDLSNGWFYCDEDGFFYYSSPISPGNATTVLIDEAKLNDGISAPTGTDGTKYHLSVEIVASAIQSLPSSTVTEQWGVTVGTDLKISK